MSREKCLAILLVVLIASPIVYEVFTAPDPLDFEQILFNDYPSKYDWRSSEFDRSAMVLPILYGLAALTVGLLLLAETRTVENKYRWIWVVFFVLLWPAAAIALLYRVVRGPPVPIPKTVEQQRQIIRDRVDQIREQRK